MSIPSIFLRFVVNGTREKGHGKDVLMIMFSWSGQWDQRLGSRMFIVKGRGEEVGLKEMSSCGSGLTKLLATCWRGLTPVLPTWLSHWRQAALGRTYYQVEVASLGETAWGSQQQEAICWPQGWQWGSTSFSGRRPGGPFSTRIWIL